MRWAARADTHRNAVAHHDQTLLRRSGRGCARRTGYAQLPRVPLLQCHVVTGGELNRQPQRLGIGEVLQIEQVTHENASSTNTVDLKVIGLDDLEDLRAVGVV